MQYIVSTFLFVLFLCRRTTSFCICDLTGIWVDSYLGAIKITHETNHAVFHVKNIENDHWYNASGTVQITDCPFDTQMCCQEFQISIHGEVFHGQGNDCNQIIWDIKEVWTKANSGQYSPIIAIPRSTKNPTTPVPTVPQVHFPVYLSNYQKELASLMKIKDNDMQLLLSSASNEVCDSTICHGVSKWSPWSECHDDLTMPWKQRTRELTSNSTSSCSMVEKEFCQLCHRKMRHQVGLSVDEVLSLIVATSSS